MELHQLRCFAAAVEEGGFKRATTRLGISQPAVSYQIKQLEEELGVELFYRMPTGVSPTEIGRVLYEYARQMMDVLLCARRAVEEHSDNVMGQIRIGSVNSVGIYFLPKVLKNLREKYRTLNPTVHYQNSREVTSALLANDLDIALVANPLPDPRLREESVIDEEISLVCGLSHSMYGRESVSAAELSGVGFVCLSPESPTGELISNHLARLGVGVERVVATDNLETAKKMVQIGLGVSFLPDMVTEANLDGNGRWQGPQLHRIRIDGPPLRRRVSFLTWSKLGVGRALGAFIDEVRTACGTPSLLHSA